MTKGIAQLVIGRARVTAVLQNSRLAVLHGLQDAILGSKLRALAGKDSAFLLCEAVDLHAAGTALLKLALIVQDSSA